MNYIISHITRLLLVVLITIIPLSCNETNKKQNNEYQLEKIINQRFDW